MPSADTCTLYRVFYTYEIFPFYYFNVIYKNTATAFCRVNLDSWLNENWTNLQQMCGQTKILHSKTSVVQNSYHTQYRISHDP